MAMTRTHAYRATTRIYPARARHYPTAAPAGPERAAVASSTVMPTLRFLGLLLLLTPLLGGVNLLVHPPQPLPPEVVTQVVEVTRPVYVTVPVPTVVVVEVPVVREPAVAAVPRAADTSSQAASVVDPEVALAPGSETAEASLEANLLPAVAPPVVEVAARPVTAPALPVAPRVAPQPAPAEPEAAPQAEAPVETPAEVVAEVPAEEPVEVAAAPDSSQAPALAARQAVAEFYAYTEQNWSVKGYSSAEQMREELGNSGSGWLREAKSLAASAEPAPGPAEEEAAAPPEEPAPVLASLVEAPPPVIESEPAPAITEEPVEEPLVASVEEPSGEPEEFASAPAPSHSPVLAARSAVADFNAHVERNWSIQGYSSPEEMREALGNSRSGWLAEAEALARSDSSEPGEAED